jgi:hypothetical protein
MTTGATVPLAAQITGDTTNSGVTWSCSPGNSAATCGQFSSSDSLQTTYTAPSVIGNVTITVSSVHQSSASANAQVTIAAPLLADGNYVFSLSGTDTVKTVKNMLSAYFLSGVFTVANGAITAGEQDSADVRSFGTAEQINPIGSSITQTADGNLQIVLAIICPGQGCTTGVNGVETFNASFLPQNSKKGNLIEFDASASASGTLELQDSTAIAASPSNGYAFAVNGLDGKAGGQSPAAIGGVIDVPIAGTISQLHSVFDINDGATTVQLAQTFAATSTVSVHPDPFGRVEFDLVPTSPTLLQFNLAGYIVDGTHIELIETRGDLFQGTLGGVAFSQGTNTGNFSSASIAGDSYILGLTGSHFNFETIAPLQIAALLTFNSDFSISGFVSNESSLAPVSITTAPAPNYTVDAAGRVAVSGVTVGSAAVPFSPALYLDGNGHAVAINLDPLISARGHVLEGGFLQTGSGSFTTGSFNGKYGFDATGWDNNTTGELDAAGSITASGSSGTFSGTVDLNWLNSSSPTRPGLAVSGDLTAAANGIFTGTITGLDVTTPTNNDIFNFYLIDPAGEAIAIETDSNQLTLLFINQQ